MMTCKGVSTQYRSVTDGQTDRSRVSISVLARDKQTQLLTKLNN